MTVHLVKLSVGSESFESLAEFQAMRRQQRAALGEAAENIHVTRMFPRRKKEVLDGGSIYWVIKGYIRARQKILRLDEILGEDGITRCGIVLDPHLVRTVPQARRPHQGWRYFRLEDAPADLDDINMGTGDELPPQLIAELKELGLM